MTMRQLLELASKEGIARDYYQDALVWMKLRNDAVHTCPLPNSFTARASTTCSVGSLDFIARRNNGVAGASGCERLFAATQRNGVTMQKHDELTRGVIPIMLSRTGRPADSGGTAVKKHVERSNRSPSRIHGRRRSHFASTAL